MSCISAGLFFAHKHTVKILIPPTTPCVLPLRKAFFKGEMIKVEQLLIAEEVATILRVQKWRVYEMVRMNIIPHIKMGRQIRFSESALRDWISRGGHVS